MHPVPWGWFDAMRYHGDSCGVIAFANGLTYRQHPGRDSDAAALALIPTGQWAGWASHWLERYARVERMVPLRRIYQLVVRAPVLEGTAGGWKEVQGARKQKWWVDPSGFDSSKEG